MPVTCQMFGITGPDEQKSSTYSAGIAGSIAMLPMHGMPEAIAVPTVPSDRSTGTISPLAPLTDPSLANILPTGSIASPVAGAFTVVNKWPVSAAPPEVPNLYTLPVGQSVTYRLPAASHAIP